MAEPGIISRPSGGSLRRLPSRPALCACSIAAASRAACSSRRAGEHSVAEHAVGAERALRDDALASLKRSGRPVARPSRCAVSVTTNSTDANPAGASGSRSTMPPMRNGGRPAPLAEHPRGEKKNDEVRLERVQHEATARATRRRRRRSRRSGGGGPSVARLHAGGRGLTSASRARDARAGSRGPTRNSTATPARTPVGHPDVPAVAAHRQELRHHASDPGSGGDPRGTALALRG